jgi:hypothetical protein
LKRHSTLRTRQDRIFSQAALLGGLGSSLDIGGGSDD